jgi:hypothetical protein
MIVKQTAQLRITNVIGIEIDFFTYVGVDKGRATRHTEQLYASSIKRMRDRRIFNNINE